MRNFCLVLQRVLIVHYIQAFRNDGLTNAVQSPPDGIVWKTHDSRSDNVSVGKLAQPSALKVRTVLPATKRLMMTLKTDMISYPALLVSFVGVGIVCCATYYFVTSAATWSSGSDRLTFRNWSGNIHNKGNVLFPKNDADIKKSITEARSAGGKVSVVGTGHSCSPSVCDSIESVSVLSLASYSMASEAAERVADFQVDEEGDFPVLTVNAGWNLDHIMRLLGAGWPRYILETQPAGRIFSLGGLVSMSTHGGCMKGGFIADSVSKLRIIGADAEVRIISAEEELRYYRMSMGVFGVITHVTLRLRRITELELATHKGDGDDMVMTQEFFEQYFKDKTSSDTALFQQFFFDFHHMKICYGRWRESGVPRTTKIYDSAMLTRRGGSRGLGGAKILVHLDSFLDKLNVNYRRFRCVCSWMVRQSCIVPAEAWETNAENENDAFWVSSLPTGMPRSHWIAYFIPVDLPDTSNIFKSVKVVYDAFCEIEKRADAGTKIHYRPDVAIEARFVWSSDSYFAPAFHEERHKQLYFVVEQPTLSSNLYSSRRNFEKRESDMLNDDVKYLNKQYADYFKSLEDGWQAIDPRAKPHLAKIFGYGPDEQDPSFCFPYDRHFCQSILGPDRQAKILSKMEELDPTGVFRNTFVMSLVAGEKVHDATGPETTGVERLAAPEVQSQEIPTRDGRPLARAGTRTNDEAETTEQMGPLNSTAGPEVKSLESLTRDVMPLAQAGLGINDQAKTFEQMGPQNSTVGTPVGKKQTEYF